LALLRALRKCVPLHRAREKTVAGGKARLSRNNLCLSEKGPSRIRGIEKRNEPSDVKREWERWEPSVEGWNEASWGK